MLAKAEFSSISTMPEKIDLQNLILKFIAEQNGCKEFELMSFIKQTCPQFFDPLGNERSLYRKHFYLFNYLHALNKHLVVTNQRLDISVLDIKLRIISTRKQQIGPSDDLYLFYSDKKNLELSEQELDKMMNKFWQKYLALDKKAEALNVLGLENDGNLTLLTLKKRYNKLAKLHHPDMGGNKNQFIKIKKAYGDLKPLF